MQVKMKSLAIIPARGGSKRLPNKNLYLLGGKPLLVYTLESAVHSQCFEKIILSSDSDDILALADEFDAVIPEKRPAHLATDKADIHDLVSTFADRTDLQQEKFDCITLLLPTCPFRQAIHIQEGMAQLTPDVDAVISFTEYEFPPQLSVRLDDNGMMTPTFSPSPLITGEIRSQDQQKIYRPNGGLYITWWESYLTHRNYFRGQVKGYVMPRENSVDIDMPIDALFAEMLLNNSLI